jgi:hypothetical protein
MVDEDDQASVGIALDLDVGIGRRELAPLDCHGPQHPNT